MKVTNSGSSPMNLTGWKLTDERGEAFVHVLGDHGAGRRIVEYEQRGSRRGEYGEQVLKELSHRLTEEFGRGFSTTNLKYLRRFYLEYHENVPQIPQTVSAQLPAQTQTETPIGQTVSAQFTYSFTLSWSHYVFLMRLAINHQKRSCV